MLAINHNWYNDTHHIHKKKKIFFSLCGGTLGTVATTGLLYQPRMIGDGDYGEIGGMKIGRGNLNTRSKPALHHFVHHKSHMIRPGFEPGPPQWEASDYHIHKVLSLPDVREGIYRKQNQAITLLGYTAVSSHVDDILYITCLTLQCSRAFNFRLTLCANGYLNI
jgi:hypothetical protein